MKMPCLSIEEITSLEATGSDAAHRHIAICPRCGALAAAYAEFMRVVPAEGADVRDADRRLAAFIDERVERAPAGAAERPPRRGFSFSIRRSLVLGASATVLLLAAVTVLRNGPGSDEMILRGSAERSSLAPYTVAASGSIPLIWAPVEGADAYRISILGEDLTERARIEPVAENVFEFAPADHALARGRYFWEVTALADGDAIASAGPAPLIVR